MLTDSRLCVGHSEQKSSRHFAFCSLKAYHVSAVQEQDRYSPRYAISGVEWSWQMGQVQLK